MDHKVQSQHYCFSNRMIYSKNDLIMNKTICDKVSKLSELILQTEHAICKKSITSTATTTCKR